ncbi:Ribose import ATP-binding protein RbsA [Posidoniimonas polymericola]|uniref:Ribose import ATP-binding protein RbsA n=1 Tax=Posidoniimonas polymericola TaxID=2528002 RepID=A0A5C5ZFM4_9BACT|nr:sugar ABC transporter ATP-binding protein [Posidoniimonas polymericola]TWT86006.1 Ribose import ATP-binding protein RbsA [Posidoniimonas polymericola]
MPHHAEPKPTQPVLEATDIVKTFPGVRALGGVSLRVERGRLNALLGENGAGKSTLMNILAGVFPPDSGEIVLEGQPVRFTSPRAAQEAGVSIIHQELNLAPNLSVAENMFLGREPRNRLGLVDYTRMNRDATVLLKRLNLDVDPARPVEQLTVASQQVVEIARALSFNSKVLILDEPTSALSEQETHALFSLIAQLKLEGVGLVYITHRLEELDIIADDITVFRDGEFIEAKPYVDTTRHELIRLMVGRDIVVESSGDRRVTGKTLLEVRGLSLRSATKGARPVLRDISFELARGEVLGVFGLMGAGRTELLQALFGAFGHLTSGEIAVDGRPGLPRSPAEAIGAGIGLAPEDRKQDGLALSMGVGPNISLPCLARVLTGGLLSKAKEDALAERYGGRMAIKSAGPRQAVRTLSGGNQQKVVLAKWLATEPKVLMLDEPTRGIDIGAKREIYTLIDELAASGLGVLMVSSELPEVLALSDRILVLSEGRLIAEFTRDEATDDKLLAAALPTTQAGSAA